MSGTGKYCKPCVLHFPSFSVSKVDLYKCKIVSDIKKSIMFSRFHIVSYDSYHIASSVLLYAYHSRYSTAQLFSKFRFAFGDPSSPLLFYIRICHNSLELQGFSTSDMQVIFHFLFYGNEGFLTKMCAISLNS